MLYDHLAPESLLDLAPSHAERIYVGKKRASHALTQEEICELLVERARRGLTVVRLKGGDPFIFGRGGEELAHLELLKCTDGDMTTKLLQGSFPFQYG